jgi:hypothetical protein
MVWLRPLRFPHPQSVLGAVQSAQGKRLPLKHPQSIPRRHSVLFRATFFVLLGVLAGIDLLSFAYGLVIVAFYNVAL